MRERWWIGPLLLVIALTGCTHAIPLRGTLDAPPKVEQAPVAVGVYHSPEFRSYRHAGSRGGDTWEFTLGPPSVMLVDRALSLLFESVQPVTSRSPIADRPALGGVIEPRIEGFDFGLPMLKTGTYTAEITYRFLLYAPNGDPVASWAVKGVGAKPGELGFEFARWPGEAADLAMQDAIRKMLAGFRDMPETRRWLAERGVRSVAAPTTAGAPAAPAPAMAMAPMSPPSGTAATPMATTAAPPPAAVAAVTADPALRAIVGSWSGTLTSPYSVGGNHVQPVNLRVYDETGRVAWALSGGRNGNISGSGHVRVDGGAVVLSGSQRWGGSPTQVELVLERRPGTLEGSVLGPDNRVHTLSLQRVR